MAFFPYAGALAIGGGMASFARLQEEVRQTGAASSGQQRESDWARRLGRDGINPAGCGAMRWMTQPRAHRGAESELSIRVTATPNDPMAPRAFQPRTSARVESPPRAQQSDPTAPFRSPQSGQSAQSDGGGGTVMYTKQELDSYTTNYDLSTMSLSIDEFLARRQRRRGDRLAWIR